MPWQKGKSGNPNGRPPNYDPTTRMCQEHAPKALARLLKQMEGKDDQVAHKAAIYIIERGYGKLKDHVELSGELTHNLTAEEIRAELIKALVRK